MFAGEVTDSCASAYVFDLFNGVLTRLTTLTPVSVDPEVPIAAFNNACGSVTDGFSLENNILIWQNSEFPQGFASFCEQDLFIHVTFAADARPVGCITVALVVILGSYAFD